jgi:glyoxylase-like metal-dependent hydrolase (beta-lactamase superfamily II)
MIPQPLVETRQLGRFRMHAIQAGGQSLDGGAMFGIVPKPLWERRIAPDARNRIQLGMRCLLIEHETGPILIDTGAGNKEDAKFYDIYGVENAGTPGPTCLEDGRRPQVKSIRPARSTPTSTSITPAGTPRATPTAAFVRLRQRALRRARGRIPLRDEYERAHGGSYFNHNFVPPRCGAVRFRDRRAIVRHTRHPTPGHTPHHQSILIESGGERALFIADLAPTTAHLPLAWIMGYDVEPLVTLETKRRVLTQAVAEDWLLVFEHDAKTAWSPIVRDGKGFGLPK